MKFANQLFDLRQSLLRDAKKQFLFSLLAVSVSLALSAVCLAGSGDKSEHKSERTASTIHCDVENFGQVTDFFYRGAQPKGEEYNQLAAMGVKTVIDLRNDPKSYAKNLAQKAGLRYINFPLSDKDYPAADAAQRFLELVNDKANQPVYVHCAGGRHRTGIMTAVYRLTVEGWNIDKAYSEMKQYDFYTRWGHEAMKKYIFDYSRDLALKQPNTAFEMPLQSQSDTGHASTRVRRATEPQR